MKAKTARFKDQPALLLLCILMALVVCVIVVGFVMLGKANRDLYVSDTFTSGSSRGVADNMSRGWLPGWFPPSASDIDHTHDLSSNLSLTNFSIPTVEAENLITSSCLQWQSAREELFVPGAFPTMELWNKNELLAGIRSGDIRLYKCDEREGQEWVLALEPIAGRGKLHAYVWNNPHLK